MKKLIFTLLAFLSLIIGANAQTTNNDPLEGTVLEQASSSGGSKTYIIIEANTGERFHSLPTNIDLEPGALVVFTVKGGGSVRNDPDEITTYSSTPSMQRVLINRIR